MTSGLGASAVYAGRVMHHRRVAPTHRFVYPLFMWLLDLDDLPSLHDRVRGFAHNRRGAVAFHDADHFDGTRDTLRSQVRAAVERAGVSWPGGPVRVLTHCRIFGYVFNPVSFWYCCDADARPAAVVVEVNNTFGERHIYVSRRDERAASEGVGAGLRWHDKKVFHVSPFFSLEGTYGFALQPPGERLRARIDLCVAGQPHLRTVLALTREPMTATSAVRMLVRYPFITGRVIAGIHWEAFRLWRKGARYHRKPAYDPAAALQTRT